MSLSLLLLFFCTCVVVVVVGFFATIYYPMKDTVKYQKMKKRDTTSTHEARSNQSRKEWKG